LLFTAFLTGQVYAGYTCGTFTESTSESHMAASKLMVDQADELYAAWDAKPARAYGGTADVVACARERGTPVRVIWPDGAQRG
jgi:hypothetical protein